MSKLPAGVGGAIRLEQRVGRALDRPLHAEAVQQVANERRLAGAERPVQLDEGIVQRIVSREHSRRAGAGGLVGPGIVARF